MSYPGGKNGAGVYQRLINLMPPHSVYLEPFLGGATILRLKRPAAVNIGIDLEKEVIRASALALNVEERSPNELIRCWQTSRKHRQDQRASTPAVVAAAVDAAGAGNIDKSNESTRLFLAVSDGLTFLESQGPHLPPDALVYCDPPYMMETRTRALYRFEMSDAQHKRLLKAVRKLRCSAIVSGYETDLYKESLKDWNVQTFQAMTRGGYCATEWVWYNFPTPTALHDYRYLGRDFRERERIKRKTNRWKARLSKMPLLEKQALLAALSGLD